MAGAVCRFKPVLILDWGTHIGKSARVFRETIKAFGVPCAIHSIDLPDDVQHGEHPKNERGKLVRGMAEVTLHQGDGVTIALEQCAANKRPGNVLFYVDGDHSKESVVRELGAILAQVPDAIVLLHDTFYQSPDSAYNIGPYAAIEEVLAAQSRTYGTAHHHRPARQGSCCTHRPQRLIPFPCTRSYSPNPAPNSPQANSS
ncbi:MAG: class I SAM-dependent methyltransferase [Flavobacteriales bacterium]|nr:class I SAM-dependent methyltransferase [Flavobacteriales bacterium]